MTSMNVNEASASNDGHKISRKVYELSMRANLLRPRQKFILGIKPLPGSKVNLRTFRGSAQLPPVAGKNKKTRENALYY